MITVFYSYKGGVGRSMALANVAWLLYRLGMRVTVVDWDLEAPGIDRFFADAAAQERKDEGLRQGRRDSWDISALAAKKLAEFRRNRGLVDLLDGYCARVDELASHWDSAGTGSSTDEPGSQSGSPGDAKLVDEHGVVNAEALIKAEFLPKLAECLTTVIASPTGATIRLLSAGRMSMEDPPQRATKSSRRPDARSYEEKLRSLSWSRLYREYGGALLFRQMREELSAGADVVLIDSRTGITETGGTSVLEMADLAILMCYPNRQNLDGIMGVARAIENQNARANQAAAPANRREIRWLPVLSRADISEPAAVAAFEEECKREFVAVLSKRISGKPENNERTPDASPATWWEILLANKNVNTIRYFAKIAFQERIITELRGSSAEQIFGPVTEAYREIARHILYTLNNGLFGAHCARRARLPLVYPPNVAPKPPTPLSPQGSEDEDKKVTVAEPVTVMWIPCAESEIEWAHWLATCLAGRPELQGLRLLVGLGDAMDWWARTRADAASGTDPKRRESIEKATKSRNPFAWLADPLLVRHIVPLFSRDYLRDAEKWDPLLMGFEKDQLEDVLYGREGVSQIVRPILLCPFGVDGIPASLRAIPETPRWETPDQIGDAAFLTAIVNWIVNTRGKLDLGKTPFQDPLAANFATKAVAMGIGLPPISRSDHPDDFYPKRLKTIKEKCLDWDATTGSARKWWLAFEEENKHRIPLVVRLVEELMIREATITEFFLAYVYSNTDNIQANLHYLDYTRLKKVEEKKKREAAAAAKQLAEKSKDEPDTNSENKPGETSVHPPPGPGDASP